jgi:hypothetical protein
MTEEINLGKLEKVPLRDIWSNEATNFTTWLAKEENLEILSEEIGIDINLLQTEANVGDFNVDILAEEENTGRKIVIENQLEVTNHDHLGKIVTYASGHDAEIIIWIVKDVRDEHKQAIDWLNEHTDEKINFFAIKMELWKVGDSSPAPKFQIISKPNDWAKTIKKSTGQSTLTQTKLSQLEFWNKFIEYSEEKGNNLRLRKANPQHWYDLSVGSSDAHISLTINTQLNEIGCELYIQDKKELFTQLRENKEKIEAELEETLNWMELEGKKASRIKLVKNADINNLENREEYFEWLKIKAEKFIEVFSKYIRETKIVGE